MLHQDSREKFRSFLQAQVQRSDCHVTVRYLTAGNQYHQAETFSFTKSSTMNNPNDTENRLELSILTPAFYTNFVQHEHVAEAFSAEMLCAREEDRTIWVSKPELLPMIFRTTNDETLPAEQMAELRQQTWPDSWRWSALQTFRRALKLGLRRPDKEPMFAPGLGTSKGHE